MNHRQQLLNSANLLINGDRNVQYGDPADDFKRTSIYWSTHIGGVLRRRLAEAFTVDEQTIAVEDLLLIVDNILSAHDVAIMMMQIKHSRLAWSPDKEDHWIDAAGYAACGWDCITRVGDQ